MDMKAVYPGHDVVSLFDTSSQTQALTRERTNRGLAMSLLSAFLVVLVLGLTLSVAQHFLSAGAKPVVSETTKTSQAEPVAFQPSRAVSSHITAGTGYIGR